MKKVSLEKIILKSKKYIFGDLLGNNNSKILGDGYDFAQISPYVYGENIRRIDAFSSAKSGELHTRSYYESKEVNLHAVVLGSGSLHFGTKKLKQDVIAEVVGLLGFSAIKNADSFSFAILSDKLLYQSLSKKNHNSITANVDKVLSQNFLGQKLDADFVSDYLLNHIKKRSLVFLISDFFDNFSLSAASKKHEIIAIKVRDIFEEKPSEIGFIDILNPINFENTQVAFEKNEIKNYQASLKKHDSLTREHLRKCGIKIVDIYTHENPYVKLEKALRFR